MKPTKCRSLGYRQFRPGESTRFKRDSAYDPLLTVDEVSIQCILQDEPPMFKHLGRWFQVDWGEDHVRSKGLQVLKDAIQLIDSTRLTGPMNAWLGNHMVMA